MRRTIKRSVALALLFFYTACMTGPRPVDEPREYIATENPNTIVLERANGDQITVDGPRVFGDTLLGYTKTPQGAEEVWIGFPDIERISVQRVDKVKTGLLVGVGLAGTIAGLAALSGSGPKDPRVIEEEEDSRVFLLRIRF